jgi:hydrophobe/amphiphile efflux-3 (HAE3) family protein
VLLLSPVPMVRGFGVVLVLGIVFAFGCALTAGFAALSRFGDRPARKPRERPADVPPMFPRVRERLGRIASAAIGTAVERPKRVLAAGLVLAVLGWAADTQTKVISDVTQLVPQNLQALKDVKQLENATGVSGELDVTVHAKDLTDPSVVTWMTQFEQRVLAAHGYKTGDTCNQAKNAPELCPALSLPDLFSASGGTAVTQQSIRSLLSAVPPYFSQGVISRDHTVANMAFGIRLMPLDKQKKLIDDIRSQLKPPPGVTANVVGLPVLAAEANAELSSTGRRDLTLLVGLVAVFLVLLAIRRRLRDAAVPLIPIAFATGWSALVLFLLRIPLNPMSAALGALVIAISTEFSVLLSARYREERNAGAGPARALELTYASTGSAVLASGTTAIAGFAALIVSDIRMLRDFGIVTVVDLTVSLLGVMIVLPAALMWAEQHGPFTLRDLDPRRLLARLRFRRPRLQAGD